LCIHGSPVEDGVPLDPALLAQGVQFIRSAIDGGHIALVACGAGISRSASFAIAVIKEQESLSLWEAWQIVQGAHSPACPHPALWKLEGGECRKYEVDPGGWTIPRDL